jgi:putative hemolysin
MKSRWIEHAGKQIFYVDFSNFGVSRTSLEEEVQYVSSVVTQKPERSVLGLVDTRNTVITMAMSILIKGYARRLGRHILKAAVVVNSVNDAKKTVFSSIARAGRRDVVLFDNVEEAKEWLADNG